MLEKSAIIAATLAIFLVVGEFCIRIFLNHHTIYDIEMSRYAVRLKTDSANPRIGHVHRPNKKSHLMNVDVSINSDGLRDKEYPVARNGQYRMIFLGDSLTFGWGVGQDDTFDNVLEVEFTKRQPTEILNFGAGNYNTEQEVNLFLEKGLKYNPDKVVVFYFINDAEPTPKKSRWSFLENSQLISFYWSRFHVVKNRFFPAGSYKQYYSRLYADDQPGLVGVKNSFLLLKETCKRHKIALQVVLLPELHNVVNYPFSEEYGKIETFLKQNQISYMNVLPAFKDYSDPVQLWVSLDDAHPNKLAHSIIAKEVLNFIAPQPGGKRESFGS